MERESEREVHGWIGVRGFMHGVLFLLRVGTQIHDAWPSKTELKELFVKIGNLQIFFFFLMNSDFLFYGIENRNGNKSALTTK